MSLVLVDVRCEMFERGDGEFNTRFGGDLREDCGEEGLGWGKTECMLYVLRCTHVE